jgi:hypothetical protein
MSMMASAAPQSTTAPCPRLNGQCTGDLPNHEHHWGPDYQMPAPRAGGDPAAYANLVDFGQEGPRLNVSMSLDIDMRLPELDQLIAGMKEFTRWLELGAAHLAAAERLHEATR